MFKMTREIVEGLLRDQKPGEWVDLSGWDLSGLDLSGLAFKRVDFSKSNFYGTNCSGAFFSRVNFNRAQACEADFSDTWVHDADFTYSNLDGVDFSNSHISWSNFGFAYLGRADLSGCSLCLTSFVPLAGKVFEIAGLLPGKFYMYPTPACWEIIFGTGEQKVCWRGNLEGLRELTAVGEWVDSYGERVSVNRPLMNAVIAAAAEFQEAHPDAVSEMADYWGKRRESA